MLVFPEKKYRRFNPFSYSLALTDRRWPDQSLTHAPIWMSSDLRDGNQALFEPMDEGRKMRLFKTLVEIGVKEIEVAFPSASQVDFDFVRTLIEGHHIPDDVTIAVLTQARRHLIERTFEALRGAKRAIVHVYSATAPVFREIVFNQDRAGVKALAIHAAELLQHYAAMQPETAFTFQYSPEVFTGTEPDFALEVVNAVIAVWQPTPQKKCIINLPATVEINTPNVYADQIEWMHRYLDRRDSVVLSVHPHNDRGTAVAAAEFALMAGAERVEGCLFGHGERTGNVDLVTLALNFYSQGVDPQLDFSRLNEIARTVEYCTGLPVHPRHPYAGDLVFTAFSGSHQDAIKKGLAVQPEEGVWQVPYLPVDPSDLGRSYDSVIRVNSQSGKGGIAYLLETAYGLVLPRRLQVEFSALMQGVLDEQGGEMSAEAIWQVFCVSYFAPDQPYTYIGHELFKAGDQQGIRLTVRARGEVIELEGAGNGPIDAVLQALGNEALLLGYEEHALEQGSDARAIAFVELAPAEGGPALFGVGLDANIVTASILAIISGVNRLFVRMDKREVKAVLQNENG